MQQTTFSRRQKLYLLLVVIISVLISRANAEDNEKPRPKKIGKDIRDYSDADMEHLLDQWEENEEPLEEDELPEHLRPQPRFDIKQVNMKNPDDVLKMTKKNKSVMMFVDVNPELSESKADEILKLWQSSLQNNHIICERYPIDKKRAIFMFRDGAQVIDAKNFLIEQRECSHVTIDGQNYIGKYASERAKEKLSEMQPKGTVEKVEL